jgi:hypothetical protein
VKIQNSKKAANLITIKIQKQLKTHHVRRSPPMVDEGGTPQPSKLLAPRHNPHASSPPTIAIQFPGTAVIQMSELYKYLTELYNGFYNS